MGFGFPVKSFLGRLGTSALIQALWDCLYILLCCWCIKKIID